MEINNKEVNVEDLVKEFKPEFLESYNGIYLRKSDVEVLKQNGFDINKYNDVKSLIFDIEEQLNDNSDNEILEKLLDDLSEYNYYNNTNK